jgi:hypothetical protein
MQGIKYILQISGGTLLVVFIIVFSLRGCGLTRKYSPHHHPLMAEPKPWLFLDSLSPNPNLPWGSANVPLWTVHPGELSTLEEPLHRHAQDFPGSMAFWLPQNAPGFTDEMIALTQKLGFGQRAVFLSPHDGLIKDLRKDLPEALFSLGMADTTQFYLLHTFFLESLAQFTADLLLMTPEFLNTRREVPSRVLNEIGRRHKSVLLDLRQGGDEQFFWEIPADGYILPATHKQLDILNQLRTKEGGQEAQ